jgi:DNA-binding transcriptional ArsR family regulator
LRSTTIAAISVSMQRPFVHPALEDITLESVLYALADPTRLAIIRKLASRGCPTNCQTAAPDNLPKSTQSHHYQVLREAGLIRSERRGTEVVNTLRCGESDGKFPGLVPAIMKAASLSIPECTGENTSP